MVPYHSIASSSTSDGRMPRGLHYVLHTVKLTKIYESTIASGETIVSNAGVLGT